MPVIRRGLQSKVGITIRTRKGSAIFPETSPQNTVAFGLNAGGAGGANFLAAPGAGFCWVITSLVCSFLPTAGNTVTVQFTGGLAAQASQNSTSTTPQVPAVLVNAPTAMPANTAFGYTIGGTGGTVSISGTAYKATIGTTFNAIPGQVTAIPIDSNPSADIG